MRMRRLLLSLTVIALLLVPLVPAAAQGGGTVVYTVTATDAWLGLTGVAQHFCTDWVTIWQLNPQIVNPNYIYIGQRLVVPNSCAPVAQPAQPDGQGGPLVVSPPTAQVTAAGIYDRGPQEFAQGTLAGNVYTVEYLDRLGRIAARFGVSWQALAAANGILNPNYIRYNARLVIPGL